MGPTALVTGSSSGVGQALAIELAQRGVDAWGVARSQAGLERTRELAGARSSPLPSSLDFPAPRAGVVKPTAPHFVEPHF